MKCRSIIGLASEYAIFNLKSSSTPKKEDSTIRIPKWKKKIQRKKLKKRKRIIQKDPLELVPNALPSDQLRWRGVPWRTHKIEQYGLQNQIYFASKEQKSVSISELQDFILKQRSTKYLAVRRVAETHPLRRFSGCDGFDTLDKHKQSYLADHLELTGLSRRIIYYNMFPDETKKKRYEVTPNEEQHLMRTMKKGIYEKRIYIKKKKKRQYDLNLDTRQDEPKEDIELKLKEAKNFEALIPIPTMGDRARQAMVSFALVPEWEYKLSKFPIYGYRPGKSLKMTILKLKEILKNGYTEISLFRFRPKKSNFQYINSNYLKSEELIFGPIYHNGKSLKFQNLKNLFKKRITNEKLINQINSWIDSGIFDKDIYHKSIGRHGEEYACPVAPALSNIITYDLLDSLKSHLNMNVTNDVAILDYCGDLAIFCKSEDLKLKISHYVNSWMTHLDLENSNLDTNYNIENFNYLGFSFSKTHNNISISTSTESEDSILNYKIRPDEESIENHKLKLISTFTLSRKWYEDREGLIRRLNPIIESFRHKYGFTECHASLKAFDDILKKELLIWIEDENALYWKQSDIVNFDKVIEDLNQDPFIFKTKSVMLLRHVDIKLNEKDSSVNGAENPFDGNYEYWVRVLSKVDKTQHPAFIPS